MDIFIYGTLHSKALRRAVAGGRDLVTLAAELHDYRVQGVAGDVVPCIIKQQGQLAAGLILCDVDDQQRARLDSYEGAFGYQLRDIVVQTAQGPRTVKMYHPPDDIADTKQDWSFQHWQTHFEATAVAAAQELFAHDPPLSQAQIRQQWPMIERRGWAKAQGANLPATRRFMPKPHDVTTTPVGALQGGFYKLQALEVQHRQFDGTMTPSLHREVFHGVDAVMVLPYDARRDQVLLVEQFRMGPLARKDPNPWQLEPIAGMIDAREAPLDAARRETREEAGIDRISLHPAGSYYPSPGSGTDYFHTYVGLCALPDDHARYGGLASESEDLRLHVLSRADAMALVASGEIAAGPLVTLLYWLALNLDQMRAAA